MTVRSGPDGADEPTAPDPPETLEQQLAVRLGEYRQVREVVERSVLPLATSVDGTAFSLQASLHGLQLRRGGYVALETDEGMRLGLVTDLGTTTMDAGAGLGGQIDVVLRAAVGAGSVLDGDGRPFHDARVRPASPEEVAAWARGTAPRDRATLPLGELLHAPGVPAVVDAGGFNRHTFLCGQSGSGKTYSLGVLLERLLAATTLRIVVLDPNSDYVGLRQVRTDAHTAGGQELASRYATRAEQVEVWGQGPTADRALRLRFRDLEPDAQAACLGLDPVQDREEYALLTDLVRGQEEGRPPVSGVGELLDSPAPGARELGLRAANLGVLDWPLWGPDEPSLVDRLQAPPGEARALVVDLGSLDSPEQQRVVSDAVLSRLWRDRARREPVLVVVDEAHNVCPADPTDRLAALTSRRAGQVAAEGRKFGIHLLVSTQRPAKVAQEVVSQCDNLLLMRMNSVADLDDLARLFSFVPRGLLAGATSFRQGQALVAGSISPYPAYVRMGARLSEEGGGDPPRTWAALSAGD